MDQTQLVLTIALTISTIILVIIGLQLILVLRDLRKILKKVSAVFDALEKFGLSLEHGFSEIYGFLAGFKTILKVIDLVNKRKNGKEK